jgi:sodium-dependent dicarboxylate transporter 2/3/5
MRSASAVHAPAIDAGPELDTRRPVPSADVTGAGRPDTPAKSPGPPPQRARSWRRSLRLGVACVGLIVSAGVLLAPTANGLTPEGQSALAIFVACTTLWLTNVLPVGITGLFALALLGLTRTMVPADAFAAFGSSAVFFILGVFILAAALIRSGLSARLALHFLMRFGRTPYTLATGVTLIACLLTVFMPAQAAVAMLFPIVTELAIAMRLRHGASSYGKVLFFSLAWGAMVGSNASFLGSTRAPLALGMLAKTHGTTVDFTHWVVATLPLVLLGATAVPVLLRLALPVETIDVTAARSAMEHAVARLGRMGREQVTVMIIMLATVLGWVALGGSTVDVAVLALLGATAMFGFRVLAWEDLEGYIHWNLILMYGGAIALGVAIDKTGLGRWLVHAAIGGLRVPPYFAVVGIAVSTLLLSQFMSGAAAVAIILPRPSTWEIS